MIKPNLLPQSIILYKYHVIAWHDKFQSSQCATKLHIAMKYGSKVSCHEVTWHCNEILPLHSLIKKYHATNWQGRLVWYYKVISKYAWYYKVIDIIIIEVSYHFMIWHFLVNSISNTVAYYDAILIKISRHEVTWYFWIAITHYNEILPHNCITHMMPLRSMIQKRHATKWQ